MMQTIQVFNNRSIFDEVDSLIRQLPRRAETETSRITLKTLERELRQQNGGIVQCRELQQACWTHIVRLPRHCSNEEARLTFRVHRVSNRHGQTCIKIYAQPQESRCETIKMVVRLPQQVFSETTMLLQQTRVRVLREGVALIQVPIRSEHLGRFSRELQQLSRGTIVVVKSRQQRVIGADELVLREQRRSIFEELQQFEQQQQWQEDCDMEILERLVQEHNRRAAEREWLAVVPMRQAEQRSLICRIKRHEQRECTQHYIKLIGRRQDCQSKICIKVRLPSELQQRINTTDCTALKQVHIQLTREGLVLIRVPLATCNISNGISAIELLRGNRRQLCNNVEVELEEQQRNINVAQRRDLLITTCKQSVEVSANSIFEELEQVWQKRRCQQPQQCSELELLEQLLRDQQGIIASTTACQQESHCWASIVRPIWSLHQQHQVAFKVEQRSEETCLITIFATKMEQQQPQWLDECSTEMKEMKLVIRVPQQHLCDVQRTRVHLTRDGVLLVRVPCQDPSRNSQNVMVNVLRSTDISGKPQGQESWEQLCAVTEENECDEWGQHCQQMQRLQREVIEVVRTRVTPTFEVRPRFTLSRRQLQNLGELKRIKLDIQLPIFALQQQQIRAEDVIVKVRGQTVELEIRKSPQQITSELLRQPRCSWEMPRGVLVRHLKVTLSESGQLRFNFPVALNCQENAAVRCWQQQEQEQEWCRQRGFERELLQQEQRELKTISVQQF